MPTGQSVEKLHHFSCRQCQKWWTVGDADSSQMAWHCPWCGSENKCITVAVSGGFDPLHIGHVRMMEAAKALGDRLVVIINNDNWLKQKKGFAFMPQDERVELIRALACVDDVVLTGHSVDCAGDMSVADALRLLRPNIFANGGDRFSDNTPEHLVCTELGIEMVFNVGAGGKIQSSSWLIKGSAEKISNNNL